MDQRKIAAVKAADAINAIEGVPVSDYYKALREKWINGELDGEEMVRAIVNHYREIAAEA